MRFVQRRVALLACVPVAVALSGCTRPAEAPAGTDAVGVIGDKDGVVRCRRDEVGRSERLARSGSFVVNGSGAAPL